MTDRELLELAAKAAGIKWSPATTDEGIALEPKFGLWLVIDGEPSEYQRRRWNPLADDGDALRLAVKLKLTVGHNFYSTVSGDSVFAKTQSTIGEFEYVKNDPYAATRRAIVRAAAEIGRMK